MNKKFNNKSYHFPVLSNVFGSIINFINIDNNKVNIDRSDQANYYSLIKDLSKISEKKINTKNILNSLVLFNLLSLDNEFTKAIETDSLNDFILNEAKKEFELIKKIYVELSKIKEFNIKIKNNNFSNIEKLYIEFDNLLLNKSKSGFDELIKYYKNYSGGIFNSYKAFYLKKHSLIGINNYDDISFSDIVGYESQKKDLIENINNFIEKKPAFNILLYGDQGTGKSSSIKAVANEYFDKKIRIIVLLKEQIKDIPYLYKILSKRGLKFILFFDDLSFEEDEYDYKYLKSFLDGRIEKKPDNIIFAVTTNRKNIVKESWKERNSDDDIHVYDQINEKHSLIARFPIYLSFLKPNKEEYLNIVFSLIKKNKLINKKIKVDNKILTLDKETITKEALKFEKRKGGVSGRTAKIFIEFCLSKLV